MKAALIVYLIGIIMYSIFAFTTIIKKQLPGLAVIVISLLAGVFWPTEIIRHLYLKAKK